MTETTTQTEQKPAEEKPSLEDLYAEYNVAAPEQSTVAKPAEQPPAADDTATIKAEITALRQEIAAKRQADLESQQEADLNKAVATLGKEADLEGKDLVLRGYLIAKASEDERLRTLWENRDKNPTAWNKALKILGSEVKEELAIPNPQLEENQRAMEESQRASSTNSPQKPGPEDEALRMNQADFNQFWMRLAGRG